MARGCKETEQRRVVVVVGSTVGVDGWRSKNLVVVVVVVVVVGGYEGQLCESQHGK